MYYLILRGVMKRTILEIRPHFNRTFSTFFKNTPVEKFYSFRPHSQLEKKLTDIDRTKEEIVLKRKHTNGGLQRAIQKKLKYLWTYNSNALEGSRLSLGDTIFYIEEGLTVSGKPLKDFLDAENHVEAINYLDTVVTQKIPIDAHLLRSLNSILCKRIEYVQAYDKDRNPIKKPLIAGKFKTEENYVIQPDGSIHEYVPSHLVSDQVHDLCLWIEENPDQLHPISVASIAHYNMVRIHPFQDGNGRVARLLMNIILLQKSYIPAVIDTEKRATYLKTLKLADRGNLLPFIEFIADSLQTTQLNILDEINKYHTENRNGIKLT